MKKLHGDLPRLLGYPLIPFRFLAALGLAGCAGTMAFYYLSPTPLWVQYPREAVSLWAGLGCYLLIAGLGEFWNWKMRTGELAPSSTGVDVPEWTKTSWPQVGFDLAPRHVIRPRKEDKHNAFDALRMQMEARITTYWMLGLVVPMVVLLVPSSLAARDMIDPNAAKLPRAQDIAQPLGWTIFFQFLFLAGFVQLHLGWKRTLMAWVELCRQKQTSP